MPKKRAKAHQSNNNHTIPSAQFLATEQLDSDDEDISKRSSSTRRQEALSQEQQELRVERGKLYQIQQQKRQRRGEDSTISTQGRRSKDNKTPRQQKVERLRMERRLIEHEYSGSTLKKKKQKKRKLNIPLPSNK